MANTREQHIVCETKLLSNYLTKEMAQYFNRKLYPESEELVTRKVCELLKYLVLAHYIDGPIPFSNELDEVWHLWILQTAEYHVLCQALPGNKFIHHSSNDYQHSDIQKYDGQQTLNKALSFAVSYQYNFGEFTEQTIRYWPITLAIMESESVDINGLAQYLKELGATHHVNAA